MNYISQLAQMMLKICNNSSINVKLFEKVIKPSKSTIDADFSLNCFALKHFYKKEGAEIAKDLLKQGKIVIKEDFPIVKNITIDGPYFNIKLDRIFIAKSIFPEIYNNIDNYTARFYLENESKQKIVIEFPSPNTNKPLHLGHVRNILLGQALSELNEKVGNKVFRTNLYNDRGIHICKSMLAYQKFGNDSSPEDENKKSDHFIGDYYVKYAQEEAKLKQGLEEKISLLEYQKKLSKKEQNLALIEELEALINNTEYGKLQIELKQMLVDWENNNPEIRKLWSKMNKWAEQGYAKTFETFQLTHDKTYYEHEIYDKGKEIILDGLKNGIFEELDDGAIVAKFQQKGLPKQKVLVRKDGTTLYITQDIYLAYEKMANFKYDRSIYVIGNEQNMQLRTLFAILKKLGMKAENFHYSYGMINLTTGKMKSREGTIVDADNIVNDLNEMAYFAVKERYQGLSEEEMMNRAKCIAMAALRFFIIKYDYSRDFLFDMEKSISFEGETGPYILYAYARICSIYRKASENDISVPYDPIQDKIIDNFKPNFSLLNALTNEHEENLISFLRIYPEIVSSSAKQLKPHTFTRLLYDIAQEFTAFYHSCQVICENIELRTARILLIEAVRIVLKAGLEILNIDVLTEM